MGSKKHKKHHKSEKKEKYEEKSHGGEKAVDKPQLKLILKVTGSSTPEHSDSPGTTVNISVPPLAADEESRQSVVSCGGEERHSERHKKSKKKKKKKEKEKDKERSEKKHKHHHKEKRKREREESSPDDLSIHEESPPEPPSKKLASGPAPVPVSLPLPALFTVESKAEHEVDVGREPRSCVIRQRLQEKGPLQRLLDHLLKVLEKKDVQQFFAWPVTDNIAPGYSQIIAHPMDFSTMKQKIDDNEYSCLPEFVEDFKLMCNNAMVYNRPDTIYYKAAKKLLHMGLRLMSVEKLRVLQHDLTFMTDISSHELGFELSVGYEEELAEAAQVQKGLVENEEVEPVKELVKKKVKPPKPSKFEAMPDNMTSEQILVQAKIAAQGASERLTLHRPNSKFGFLRQKRDGTTSLAVLNPGDGVTPGTKERPVSLGVLTGRLNQGSGQIQGFREDRRNLAKPVKPLYYGAFGSYAPSYDSSFANVTKEESDLIYSTYGDETATQYAESILDFAKDCDYTLHMVDNLLDLLTQGDHSKTTRVLEERRKLREEEEKIRLAFEGRSEERESTDVKFDFDSLRTLSDLGIDMGFLDSLEEQVKEESFRKEAEEAVQCQLNQTSGLLEQLEKVQKDRLSLNPPPHLAHLPPPSDTELQLADRISESLKDMARQVDPADITAVPALRKAMGIKLEPVSPASTSGEADVVEPVEVDIEGTSSQAEEAADLESELREFLDTEPNLNTSPVQDDKTIEDMISESS